MENFPGAEQKINEYVARIEAGEDREIVLQGLGPAFRGAVERALGIPESVNKEVEPIVPESAPAKDIAFSEYDVDIQKDIDANHIAKLREELGITKSAENNKGSIEKVTGIENIASVLQEITKTHYIFTHQTANDTAKQIFESNFEVSPGTGILNTMLFVGAESGTNQIKRQLEGDAHRGYSGMFIMAVPKNILDQSPRSNKTEVLEDILLESPEYGKNGNSNIVIPKEYNFAYLQGEDLYVNKALL